MKIIIITIDSCVGMKKTLHTNRHEYWARQIITESINLYEAWKCQMLIGNNTLIRWTRLDDENDATTNYKMPRLANR